MTHHYHGNSDAEAFVCGKVDAGEPVLYVSHDPDGAWQVLCGDDEHRDIADVHLACLGCVVEKFAAVRDVLDLPEGWQAERIDSKQAWTRSRLPT